MEGLNWIEQFYLKTGTLNVEKLCMQQVFPAGPPTKVNLIITETQTLQKKLYLLFVSY